MNSILEMLLTGLIDPILWIKSMSTLGCNKSKMKNFGAFLGYYLLLVGRDLLANYSNISMIKLLMSSILAVYIFVSTYFLFKGKLSEKIISICIFFCILFISELVIYELYLIYIHGAFYTPARARILNMFCGFFVKLLQGVLCYWIFMSKNMKKYFSKNKEKIAIIIVIASMLSSILLINTSTKQSKNAILLFQLIEILFIWYLVCSMVEFREKEKRIRILNDEVNGMEGRQEHVRDIDQFRHDYSSNAFVMKNLWHYKEYDKLGKYLDDVFVGVNRVELLFEHPNFAVRILVSSLFEIAKKVEIPFSAEIKVDEFQMRDEDICTVFQNLVINAFKESVHVPRSKVHVLLQVLNAKNGYEIRCVNEFVDEDHLEEIFRQRQRKNSLETVLVDEIVEKYHGVIERNCTKKEKKKLWQKEVLIRIPIQ